MKKHKRTNNDLQNIHITLNPGRVSSSCSTSDTRRVNLVTNPVISHEWGKNREVLTKSGTYPWSFVTQIFHNGQPSHLKLFHISYSYKVGPSIMNLCCLTSVSGLQNNNDFIQDTEKYPFLLSRSFSSAFKLVEVRLQFDFKMYV
jgi:hypothetical protein